MIMTDIQTIRKPAKSFHATNVPPKQETVIWATKYALTQGIGKETATIENNIATVKCPGGPSKLYFGNNWHRSFNEAVARAEIIRDAKIKSLKKQIIALEKLTFDAWITP